MSFPARQPCQTGRSQGGFTLMELVIVMGMLIVVLTITYQLIVDCLEADRTIDKLTVPEKVGEGILSLVRDDISGTIFRGLGTRIFLVTDGGVPPDARDEIRFLSTVEPTPHEEAVGSSTVTVAERRTITGIAYFLRPSQLEENVSAYTLFRKEMIDLNPDNPLDSPGMNYEVYDKVKYLSIECFDGWSWFPDWNSEARIHAEEEDALAAKNASQGQIARVSDPQKKSGLKTSPPSTSSTKISAPGVDPGTESGSQVLPPAGIPVAVRIEVGVYVATSGKMERDTQGSPILKTFSTIVPILASQRLPILEDEEDQGGGVETTTTGPLEGQEGAPGTPGAGAGKDKKTRAPGTRTHGAQAPGARESGAPTSRGGRPPAAGGPGSSPLPPPPAKR